MLLSYVKIAIRNFMRRKVFSIINIFGLSIGFAACLILLTYIEFELSYGRHNEKADRIYRTVSTFHVNGQLKGTFPLSDFGQGPALLENIPEINNFVRTHLMHGGAVVSYDSPSKRIQFYEDESIQFVDSSYFEVFTHEAIEGNLKTALKSPNAIVLTETSARKYFGNNQNVVGKILNVSGSWWTNGDFVVTAVIKDVPGSSHLKFTFLINNHSLLENDFYKSSAGTSTEGNFVTYVELDPNADIRTVEQKLPAFIAKYQGQELKRIGATASMLLQPLTDIHLTPGYNLDMSPTIGINTLYFFIVICTLVILLAWINYINLSTARATERAKEVGIKKAIGAYRFELISQFMTESTLIHIISAFLAILIAYSLLPLVGEMLHKDITLSLTNSNIYYTLFGFILIGSFIAGAYPSFVLSSYKPITALKGINDRYSGKFTLRHALVVFQFSVSLIIVAGTFVISRQLAFMQEKDKGFKSERMLIVRGPGSVDEQQFGSKVAVLKDQIKNLSAVSSVATSEALPGGGYNWGTGMRRIGLGIEENMNGDVVFVDPDFTNTYGMDLVAGKGWNIEAPEPGQTILINETALKTFGFNEAGEAIGNQIIIGNDTFHINGVLKDYHWSSLKTPISPYVLASSKICGKYLSVNIESTNLKETIIKIEKLYNATFPEKPFEYFFLDDFFNRQYQEDQQFHQVVSLFGLLSIVIASFGLWGLAALSIGQRIKEISIRKVLGASSKSILLLLTGGFIKLILVASVVTFPIINYGIDSWLNSFSYRIEPSWDLYIFPIITLIMVSIITISGITVKASLTNPADNLKAD
jgi:putative ABC transport system permease protein